MMAKFMILSGMLAAANAFAVVPSLYEEKVGKNGLTYRIMKDEAMSGPQPRALFHYGKANKRDADCTRNGDNWGCVSVGPDSNAVGDTNDPTAFGQLFDHLPTICDSHTCNTADFCVDTHNENFENAQACIKASGQFTSSDYKDMMLNAIRKAFDASVKRYETHQGGSHPCGTSVCPPDDSHTTKVQEGANFFNFQVYEGDDVKQFLTVTLSVHVVQWKCPDFLSAIGGALSQIPLTAGSPSGVISAICGAAGN